MAAGDLALSMLLTATDLASAVVADMAATYDASLVGMGDATLTLSDYLISLGDQTFTTGVGFDGLAGSASSADASLAALDASASAADASLSSVDAALASVDTSLAAVDTSASSADAALASVDASLGSVDAALAGVDTGAVSVDTALASIDASAGSAAASLSALDASATASSGALSATAAATDAAAASEEGAALSMEQVGAAGASVAMGVGLVGTAIAVVSTKMAGDFQQAMTQLVTGAGESEANLKLVSDGILQMAVDTGTSTKQLSDGMYMIESAGFHGAAGLNVLKAAAQGAKVGNADLGTVADATTTILKDFGNTGITASNAVNALIATVAAGKTHMSDLSSSLSQVLPTASAAKVGLNDVMGAMATMTGEGVPAANAATYLRQTIIALEAPSKAAKTALQSVGLTTDQVATEMQKSLPDALKMITDAVGKRFPVGSAAYVEALKNISGGSKTMQGMLDLTGQHLKDFQTNVQNVGDAVKKGGASITGWANVQQDFNQKLAHAKEVLETFGIKIGTALLPVLGKVVDFLTGPALTGLSKFGDLIGKVIGPAVTQAKDAFDALFLPVQKLHVAVKPLTDTFDRATAVFGKFQGVAQPLTDTFDRATAVFGKFKNAASATGEAVSPLKQVLDVLIGLGKAALNMSPLVNTIEGVARHGKELGDWWQASVIPALKQAEPGFRNLGQALAGLLPAFEKIAQVVHNNFQKSFDALLPVFKQVVPIVIQLTGLLAGGLGTAIKFLTPLIVQAATAIAQFGSDIATRVAPIITGFFKELNKDMPALKAIWDTIWPSMSMSLQAAWNAIKTTVKVAWDVVTGIIKVGLDIMSGNWKQAWTDVKDTFENLWNDIKSYLANAWDIIKGQVQDGVNKIKQPFQQLYNDLVGHSIVPDMINGIVSWFQQLPGRVVSAVQSMVSQVIAQVSTMASQFLGRMSSLVGQAVSKAWDIVHGIGGVMMNMGGMALQWGINLIQGIINGINGMLGGLGATMSNVVGIIGSYMPHSPAKQGELSHLNEYGPNLVKGLANGILGSQHLLHNAMDTLTKPLGDTLSGKAFTLNASSNQAFALSGKQTIVVQVQPVAAAIHLDGKKVGESQMKYQGKEVRLQGAFRNS